MEIQEYLRQGGPLTVVRVGEPNLSKAEALSLIHI